MESGYSIQRYITAFLFILSTGIPFSVKASSPGIDALQQLRQQVREEERRKEQEKTPDVRLEGYEKLELADRLPADEKPCFVINEIRLDTESPAEFAWALDAANPEADPALGRCLGTQGIKLVIKRIQNAIIEKGFVTTRVLAQPQQLTEGVLTLSIIPGVIRDVHFVHQADDQARYWNALPTQRETLLNLRDIEQGLENLKRLPTVDTNIKIAPAEGQGVKPGESDLLIDWQQEFPVRTRIGVDDSGSDATGEYLGNIAIAYDHVFRLNDVLEIRGHHDMGGGDSGARGTKGYNLHYSVPYDYWLMFLSFSNDDYYQTVAGITQDYVYSGDSDRAQLKMARVVYRDRIQKVSTAFGGWFRSSRNYIDDTEVEVQRRRMAGWLASVNHRLFSRQSTLDTTLTYTRGTGAFNSIPAPEESFDEGDSHPQIYHLDVQYSTVQNIGEQRWKYNAYIRSQWNETPLVPQDRFTIGGRYTVRGFDGENVLSAERGWLMRNDVALSLKNINADIYFAVDYGRVSGPSSATLQGKRLLGDAIGVRGAYRRVQYDVFVGQPVSKPDGFQTAEHTVGFSVSFSF